MLTVFQSCNKTDNGGTFTLKGTCLKDCSNIPIANQKISVILTKFSNFNSKEKWLAGEGTTDANGDFSIECENRGHCEVMLEGFGGLVTKIPGGKDEVYDMEKLYANYVLVCNLKVIFQTPHSDTFYIGTSTKPFGVIPEANGTKFLRLTNSPTGAGKAYIQSSNEFTYSWYLQYRYGFSYQGYNNNLINTSASFVGNAYRACESPDTVSITIP